MKYQKVTRDPLRALTSEMLPYEVPLPFNTATLYGFLRRIKWRIAVSESASPRIGKHGSGDREAPRWVASPVADVATPSTGQSRVLAR